MEKLLNSLVGKIIDVGCGTTAMFRGQVEELKEGILFLRDEDDKLYYIAIDKIASISERSDSHSRPGFIG
jgi:hypothetical protein